MLQFNALGIAFIADDIPKRKAAKVEMKMNEIIEKYKDIAQKEFDEYLDSNDLESAMGVVIPKSKSK